MQQLNRKQATSEMQYIGCQFYINNKANYNGLGPPHIHHCSSPPCSKDILLGTEVKKTERGH
jgi:hypothetical protein